MVDDVRIERAMPDDAAAILTLQRLCFRSEAERYNDETIPPLTETLEDLAAVFTTSIILAARLDGEVVGSVRGRLEYSTCHIGRLIVHPHHQRRGIGGRLMAAIEREFSGAVRFELFTGHQSKGNLRLYRHLGYREARQTAISPQLTLVFLEKPGW